MVFDHARNTNANGGTFNDVHGDHIVNVNNSTSICFLSIKQRSPRCSPCNPTRPICGPKSLSQLQKLPIKSHQSSEANSTMDKALGFITRIETLIFDGHRCSNGLKSELKSLCQSLMLTKNAIRVYDGRPLGQSLAYTVTLEVERCCTTLQKLLVNVRSTLQGLNPTRISRFWSLVWWSRWNDDDMVTLRMDLSCTRNLLDGFLLALHSYVLPDFCASPPADIYMKYFMDERISCGRPILETAACCIWAAYSAPWSHKSKLGGYHRSLGWEYTSANYFLLYVEGRL